MILWEEWRARPVAVLVSGGLDSAILLGELARSSPSVVPVYVRFGLVWEAAEERALGRYLAALDSPRVQPLQKFDLPLSNVYGPHWSTTGRAAPDAESPDEAVFLPGRNLLLVVQAALWCHLQGIPTIALAPLAGNPFPDGAEDFFRTWERTLNQAIDGRIRLVTPYRRLHKLEVLQRGRGLPLEHTLSCIAPQDDLHCGRCNKCAERRRGFHEAGLLDPTRYAAEAAVPAPR